MTSVPWSSGLAQNRQAGSAKRLGRNAADNRLARRSPGGYFQVEPARLARTPVHSENGPDEWRHRSWMSGIGSGLGCKELVRGNRRDCYRPEAGERLRSILPQSRTTM